MIQTLLVVALAVIFLLCLVQTVRLRKKEAEIASVFGGVARSEKMAQLGRLLAGIAHELHTPMGAVNCSVDTRKRAVAKLDEALSSIEGAPPGGDVSEAVGKVRQSLEAIKSTDPVLDEAITRVRELLNELKSAGRGERVAPVPVDVNRLLDGSLLLLRHELKQNTTVERDYGELPEVPGYPGGLGQVFLNILRNASQALEGPGTLTVSSALEGDRVAVRIRDSGPGLPAGCSSQMFQAGWTDKAEGEGMGLGLFISQRIVKKHDGEINARNHPEGGAEFTITLPVAGPAAGDGV